jgi:Ala-tRNA(Pro) deacylase
MAIAQNVASLLKSSGIAYEVLKHPQAFTAQEVAATVHVTGKEVAKTIVVDVDGKFVMAVIPAPHKVSLKSLKELLGAKEVRLASEGELTQLFPDCEVGAMPPFGNLYNMPVCISTDLKDRKELIFNACTHTEVIKVSYTDFERLVQPRVGDISILPVN